MESSGRCGLIAVCADSTIGTARHRFTDEPSLAQWTETAFAKRPQAAANNGGVNMSVTIAQANPLAAANPLESFRRDGYTIFRGELDSALVSEAGGHVEWLQDRKSTRLNSSHSQI